MIENIKPVESLTVADFKAHPVWEYLNDDEIGETFVGPVKEIPVKSLGCREIGAQVRLANGLEVWAIIGNVDVANPRATRHFLALSIERSGKWVFLARYFDHDFAVRGPEALARFLGLGVDEVFPISVDIRRYVQGNPAALAFSVPKEPQERLTREELLAMSVRFSD
jgi:hypothetical protein